MIRQTFQRLLVCARRLLRHHLSAFVVTLVLCLALRECYPFSHFPMYSGISRSQHYFFIERADGEPVMIRDYFGISASSLKKIYHSHLRQLRDASGKKRDELGKEDYAAAGDALLEYLLRQGRERKAWRKAPLADALLHHDLTVSPEIVQNQGRGVVSLNQMERASALREPGQVGDVVEVELDVLTPHAIDETLIRLITPVGHCVIDGEQVDDLGFGLHVTAQSRESGSDVVVESLRENGPAGGRVEPVHHTGESLLAMGFTLDGRGLLGSAASLELSAASAGAGFVPSDRFHQTRT